MYWSLENVPWTNLHDLNLDWIVNTMTETVEQWIAYRLEMDGKYADFTTQINSDFDEFTTGINEWKTLIESEFSDLQTYVQNYFDNLDLNESTRYVINQMIASGEFVEVLNPSIVSAVESWLAEHITPTTPAVDSSLTVSGAAADAKVTGDNITMLVDGVKQTANEWGFINLIDNVDFSSYTGSGVTITPQKMGFHVQGTTTNNVVYDLFENELPAWLEVEKSYTALAALPTGCIFQIYGYNSSGTASKLYDTNTNSNPYFRIPQNFSSRIRLRFRIENNTTLNNNVNLILTDAMTQTDIANSINANYANDKLIANNVVNFADIHSVSLNGIEYTVNPKEGTIRARGTATANSLFELANFSGANNIQIGGAADGGSSNTYFLAIYDYSSGARIGYVTNSTNTQTYTLNPSKNYIFRIAILTGQTVNSIFKPYGFVGGKVIENEKNIENLRNDIYNITIIYKYYDGSCFICVCGDKLFIDCFNYRLYNTETKTFTQYIMGTFVLNNTTTNARFLNYDGDNFTLTNYKTKYTIAVVRQGRTINYIEGIICDYRQIQDGYIRSDSKFFMNFDRTPLKCFGGYDGENDVKLSLHGYMYGAPGAKTYDIFERNHVFNLTENTTNINNKKILIIGDSFVRRGYIQNYLSQFNNTLQFIGTKKTLYYDYDCEGVSGSRLYYFTDSETSPFWFENGLSLSFYLTANDLPAPDYVIINSAINQSAYDDPTHGTYLSNLQALVNMVQNYNQNIKIYVTYGANYAMEPASNYGYPHDRFREVRKSCNSIYAVDNIVIIPIDSCLIDELDYTYINYDYYGKTIQILEDCVHPTETTGFRKIAMMIYNYLGV